MYFAHGHPTRNSQTIKQPHDFSHRWNTMNSNKIYPRLYFGRSAPPFHFTRFAFFHQIRVRIQFCLDFCAPSTDKLISVKPLLRVLLALLNIPIFIKDALRIYKTFVNYLVNYSGQYFSSNIHQNAKPWKPKSENSRRSEPQVSDTQIVILSIFVVRQAREIIQDREKYRKPWTYIFVNFWRYSLPFPTYRKAQHAKCSEDVCCFSTQSVLVSKQWASWWWHLIFDRYCWMACDRMMQTLMAFDHTRSVMTAIQPNRSTNS